MRRQRAIMTAPLAQPPVEQGEMHRFVRADAHPFVGEGRRELAAEAADQVESQVDCDKFDMGERVDHGDPRPFRPDLAAPGHLGWRQQFRRGRARGSIGHGHIEIMGQMSEPPRPRGRAGGHELGDGIGGQQDMGTGCTHAGNASRQAQSACAASSTSCAWPLTFTLSQTRCRRPSASNRKVSRSMPI